MKRTLFVLGLFVPIARSGARVVSYVHDMGDWAPQKMQHVEGDYGPRKLHLWIIPPDASR